jgi:hypothetical protein
MAKLQDAAQQVRDSLRCGNLDEADRHMGRLQQQIPWCTSEEDLRVAAAIVFEARTLARVHRAQTIQALQSLVRQTLYTGERWTGAVTFEIDG